MVETEAKGMERTTGFSPKHTEQRQAQQVRDEQADLNKGRKVGETKEARKFTLPKAA